MQVVSPASVIAFGGKVVGGVKSHPDGTHITYPMGATLVVKNVDTGSQLFLENGGEIGCVAISLDGRYLATGETSTSAGKVSVAVWDLGRVIAQESAEGALLHKLLLHKGAVAAVEFSPCCSLLASVGGQDDNQLTITAVGSGKPLSSAPASTHATHALSWFHGKSDRLVTGGQYHLRTWEFDSARRRLTPFDVRITNAKRIYSAIAVSTDGKSAYCGTTSGDLMEIDVNSGVLVQNSKVRFSQGVTTLVLLDGSTGARPGLLVGTGDGALARLNGTTLDSEKVAEVMGAVTSIMVPPNRGASTLTVSGATSGSTLRGTARTTTLQRGGASPTPSGPRGLVGTAGGNIYSVDLNSLQLELQSTAHNCAVNDIAFPEGCSDLFITAAGSEIRIWNKQKHAELLRIQVPNVECLCVALASTGSLIFSGWTDGRVRAFLPESGALAFVINDAHAEGVSAVALTHDGGSLVTGGRDGRVRVWTLGPHTQTMAHSWKEHKSPVTSVRVNADGSEAISASADGSCLLWNLRRGTRANALFASTVFRAAVYHPDGSQIMTVGSDRRITYWDAADCTALRIMEGSTAEISTVDISVDGNRFATGGLDKEVKLWQYDEGELVAVLRGHSAPITKLAISPDMSSLVSAGADGAVFIWNLPPAHEARGENAQHAQ